MPSVALLHPTVVVTICFAGMVCVAPVAFYLCWLASVNRRSRPTVVSGVWDFAGLLAALSGFLLVGGMLLLSVVQNDPRLFTGGSFTNLRGVFETQWLAWVTLFAGYAGVIGLAILSAVRGGGRWLAVYNVDAHTAGDAVEQALQHAGLTATRHGNLWADQRKLVEIVPFHGTCHVTVRIVVPQAREREEIERHLRTALGQAISAENPAASWISAVAGGSVLTVVLFVGMLIYIMFTRG